MIESSPRSEERRQQNLGAATGAERRSLVDRRHQMNEQYVAFQMAGLAWMLHINEVREVLALPEVAIVPRGPSLLAGVINLRGEIVPVLDLRPALGHQEGPSPEDMLVVVRDHDGAYGLRVDAVHDVWELSPTAILEPPANLNPNLKQVVKGVVRRPEGLVLVLASQGAHLLVDHPQRALA